MTTNTAPGSEPADLVWRTSSYTGGGGGNCVETALLPTGGMAVRDSKHPQDHVLRFGRREWEAFRRAVCDEGL
jgi:hypothetical protein